MSTVSASEEVGMLAHSGMVVSTETGGLGNRLKSWVSAMRLGDRAGVVWERTANMPAGFRDLFINDSLVEAVPDDATIYKSWRLAVLPADEPYLPAGFARVGAGPHPFFRGLDKLLWQIRGKPDDRYRYMLFPKQHSRRSTRPDARHIDLEYGRIPAEIRAAYRPFFDQIRVRAEIRERIDDWASSHLDGSVVGVQVRTWRDDPRRYRKYHLPAIRRLTALVQGVPKGTRLFVVSDSDDIAPWLAGLVGKSRVIQFPRATRRAESWLQPNGIVEDLIDLMLLAKVDTLFASYLSTFSETAWWIGGAQAEVRVF